MALEDCSDLPIYGNLGPLDIEPFAHLWHQHLTYSREPRGLKLPRVNASATRLGCIPEHEPTADIIEALCSEVGIVKS